MASDIIQNLHLDKEFETSRVIVTQQINGCDSSFIVSCVLAHCIKKSKAVFLISTHNALSHYQNIGVKMNYNLQKYIDNGLVHFYDLGKENINSLLLGESNDLQKMFSNIKKLIMCMKEKHGTVSIILDGVSHLFDLQYTLTEINNFCKNLIDVIRNFNNSFVLCQCNIALEDDVSYILAYMLAYKAYTVVEVGSLASGLSADVSGHLIVRHPGQKYEPEYMFNMDSKPSKYLFKLFDRGVKLFAPGTV